ncbi:MAG: 50S ribosomal protein L9 [Bdellovibrionales bacterium]|nr:50S ribosomal protein L9 [Bdellovibrionales bacterium]
MKVILKEDIKNVGKTGDMIAVSDGFARNYLFPRKLAVIATERREKELAHLQASAEARKKKALAKRKEILAKMSNITLTFKMTAGDTDKLFGSITNQDISNELEKQGYQVDKRDIQLGEHIKVLGQHKAQILLGEGLQSEIKISVERKA